jgi:integrase
MAKIKKCIYKRGPSSFQVKAVINGKKRSQTCTTLDLAERFLDECRDGSWVDVGRSSRRIDKRFEKPRIRTLYELLVYVDNKRWHGNPDCKAPHEGSGNARRFVEWAGANTRVHAALNEWTIARFIEDRERLNKNSGGTINRYRAAISCLVTEALKLGLIVQKPDVPKRREGQPRKRVFSIAEETEILKTARGWGYDDHAELFAFLADTGCRPGEAQKLTWGDFEGDRVVHFEAEITKNSTRRTLTLTPRAAAAVSVMQEKYAGTYNGPFVWAPPELQATRRLWSALRHHLKWLDEDCFIYTFRHTCASRLVQRGIDLYRVQIWLGHLVPQMTQRYAKFAPDQLSELAAVLAAGDNTQGDD